MTKKQRAQVVELLRCAADVSATGSIWCWTDAIDGVDIDRSGVGRAYDAYDAVDIDVDRPNEWVCTDVFLEAAARVEEGSWP